LIDAAIDEVPTKWKLNITRSTAIPECDCNEDNGGYNVQPVPAPPSAKPDIISNNKDGGNNQKLKLFNLGNAISGAPINIGTKKFPKPPNDIGIITKNNISTPCIVTITL